MKITIADANATRIPIKLQVLKVNHRAQAFYQRLGFVAVGETATHILMEKPANANGIR